MLVRTPSRKLRTAVLARCHDAEGYSYEVIFGRNGFQEEGTPLSVANQSAMESF